MTRAAEQVHGSPGRTVSRAGAPLPRGQAGGTQVTLKRALPVKSE